MRSEHHVSDLATGWSVVIIALIELGVLVLLVVWGASNLGWLTSVVLGVFSIAVGWACLDALARFIDLCIRAPEKCSETIRGALNPQPPTMSTDGLTKGDPKMDYHAIKFIRENPLITIALVVGSLVILLFVWPTCYTYTTMKGGDNVVPVRINRFTGKAEFLAGTEWIGSN